MSPEADHLVARRRLRRKLGRWRIIAIVAAVAAVAVALGQFGLISRGYVARLTIQGIIAEDRDRSDAITAVGRDDSAQALIIHINSPGGTVVGGESLYRHLRAVGQRKPVVAVLGEVATSAAYMTALGTDWIIARDGTITGSIGVILQTADIRGLLDKLGVRAEVIKSDPLKAQPNPFEELTPEARQAVERLVFDIKDMFVAIVRERRGLTQQQALAVSDGRVFTGRQAVANGLVDATGSETEAQTWLMEAHGIDPTIPVRDVGEEDSFLHMPEWIARYLGKALFSETLRLDGLVSLWHPGNSLR